MFGNRNKKSKWKMEYEDTIYKIYDWNRNLAGYFFPDYDLEETEDNEDEIIEELNQSHQNVRGGNILLPMVKLNLLDKEEGMDLDYATVALEQSLQRVKVWKQWLLQNSSQFGINGHAIFTSREDREMLSIGLRIKKDTILGEKEILNPLIPLLDELHEAGLL
ncbi:MAG TPA: hypothetical protein VFY55_03385 [Nitrososphaeraceae archaeon]|nr:hypothetical protein [Nitrososphaeraceae archaeon]